MLVERSITLLIFSITYCLTSLAEPDVAETLRMAHIIFRHGARSPTNTYPTDPHRLYPWVGGFGALTTIGAEQGFALGRNLRNRRYGSLVPPNGLYSTKEMYIVSSSLERCIMTAQSFLTGFLEPPEGAVRIPISWQPATVHVLSKAEDSIISHTKLCPKYMAALAQLSSNPPEELEEWFQGLPAQYEFASRHAGKVINSTTELVYLYDAIDVQSYYGLPQPAWTSEVYPDKTIPFHKMLLLMYTATPQMKQLRGGVILTEILENMVKKRAGTLDPDRSLYFYSGQESTIVSLLNSMGMINQTTAKPEYASAIAFELHENPVVAPDFEVRMVYYEDSNVPDPRYLRIPGCDDPCALRQFEHAMQHLHVLDFDEACKIGSDAVTRSVSVFWLVLSTLILRFNYCY